MQSWWGRGAKSLQLLDKKLDQEVFAKLLDGRFPNGQKLGRFRGGNREHRPEVRRRSW
jgi:conjugative relaxase-like TrwC/TraI family protein